MTAEYLHHPRDESDSNEIEEEDLYDAIESFVEENIGVDEEDIAEQFDISLAEATRIVGELLRIGRLGFADEELG